MIYNVQFPEGVTQGWEWYTVYGGLQDWGYFWHGEHSVTIEVSRHQKTALRANEYLLG